MIRMKSLLFLVAEVVMPSGALGRRCVHLFSRDRGLQACSMQPQHTWRRKSGS